MNLSSGFNITVIDNSTAHAVLVILSILPPTFTTIIVCSTAPRMSKPEVVP